MKINLLDCTLRDGGYYNNWDFKIELVNEYLKSIAKSGLSYVEIGFRSFERDNYRGACAYTKEEFLNELKIPNSLKIVVMVNLSEIINYNKSNLIENTKKLFKSKKNSKVHMVRIASHFNELSKVKPIIKTLNKLGYKVGLNLMQISEKNNDEILSVDKFIDKKYLDILYFADSMGSLDTNDISKIISLIRTFWKKDIGIHAHDNMSRAIINSKIAVENGVTWVDSTVTGMGRGPGNAQTEYSILEFKNFLKKKINVLPLISLKNKYFDDMKKKYKWGTNIYYFLSGLNRIHPTFIQRMLEDVRFKEEDILSTINNLRSLKATNFKKELLSLNNKFYDGKTKGEWSPYSKIKGKDVLILGNGPSIEENKNILENYIINKKLFVIGLNTQKNINEKLLNLRVACNELRFLTDIKKFKGLKTKIALPLDRLSGDIKKLLNAKNILNFGLEVQHDQFNFFKKYAILPNSLAISYALAIASSGKAKKILLAGFDGYPSDDPRRIEMDHTFELFQKYAKKTKLISITSTRYKLKSLSIYAL